MLIYSKQIAQFVHEIKKTLLRVLAHEAGLKVGSSRFYDRKQKISYPLRVVIFNSGNRLGYFDPNFYELGFHVCLMREERGILHNVIRHELGHYLAWIEHGEGIASHGPEFKELCRKLGWGEEVYRATLCLEGGSSGPSQREQGVLRRVQKLMALSSSTNCHEAEAAVIKSQQLLLKHNLDATHIGSEEERFFLKRIMRQKRVNAKMRAIGRILETFFVTIVYNKSKQEVCLEILGSEVNVEIAEYVAHVLDGEMENLWNLAKKQAHLSGTVAKNSFFTGIAKGYCIKIDALTRSYNRDVSSALMVIEKKLEEAKSMAYPHLSSSRSQGSVCKKSSALGEQMGKKLTLHAALKKGSKGLGRLLGYNSVPS